MKSEINRLVDPPPPDNSIGPAEMPKAIRAKTNLAARQAGLYETEIKTVESTDGLFTFTVQVLKG